MGWGKGGGGGRGGGKALKMKYSLQDFTMGGGGGEATWSQQGMNFKLQSNMGKMMKRVDIPFTHVSSAILRI